MKSVLTIKLELRMCSIMSWFSKLLLRNIVQHLFLVIKPVIPLFYVPLSFKDLVDQEITMSLHRN